MKSEDIPGLVLSCLCAGLLSMSLYYTMDHPRQDPTVPDAEHLPIAFDGYFACEYMGVPVQRVDKIVAYNISDLGSNLGWSLTLENEVQLMYIQSADKFCYVEAAPLPEPIAP